MSESDATVDLVLGDIAARLASAAGRGAVAGLTRFPGGRNNRVYRLDIAGGESLVLKRYFSDPRDPRDRLAAEWRFLQHAWSRGVRTIPQPLASDPVSACGLYAFLPGHKLAASELGAAQVDAAVVFLLAVNAAPRQPLAFPPGSEACFSIAQHLDTVEYRVARLGDLDSTVPHADNARQFIVEVLLPTWAATRVRIVEAAIRSGLSLDSVLAPEACCISPSDFGFHNALVDRVGTVNFLDFEYAGRDDPAKLVSDFFCQPEIPVPLGYHAHFVSRLADGLGLDEAGRTRCRLLLDAYRIKWTCIVLNDFLPLGAARRAFADGGQWAARCATQLAKAKANVAGMTA